MSQNTKSNEIKTPLNEIGLVFLAGAKGRGKMRESVCPESLKNSNAAGQRKQQRYESQRTGKPLPNAQVGLKGILLNTNK